MWLEPALTKHESLPVGEQLRKRPPASNQGRFRPPNRRSRPAEVGKRGKDSAPRPKKPAGHKSEQNAYNVQIGASRYPLDNRDEQSANE
jgi:hypothetical protein